MSILENLWIAALSFLFFSFMFSPLERSIPLSPRTSFFRRYWCTDLAFFIGQYLLWGSLTLEALRILEHFCSEWLSLRSYPMVSRQPWILQAIEVIVLGDLLIYWMHRLQHRVDWLWRFHSVHHSAQDMDWLAAHREHPIDGIITQATINLPAFLLGFPLETLAGVIAFRGAWALFIHSNVKLPLGPLKVVIGSPDLHHWHHSKERIGCNYGNLSPLMDVFFGTYRAPKEPPLELGISGDFPKTYIGQLLHPFVLKKKRIKKSNKRKSPLL